MTHATIRRSRLGSSTDPPQFCVCDRNKADSCTCVVWISHQHQPRAKTHLPPLFAPSEGGGTPG
eukprot:1830694-Alexandrium_andersonii.AAC.1